MDPKPLPKWIGFLSKYYAVLQIFHLTFLTRAAILYSSTGRIPFPAQPPDNGWLSDTIPFLFGMGAVDAVAAAMALFAGWKLFFRNQFQTPLWVISLNTAITSALIFCFGTLPSGAWGANPLGYGVLAVVFSPLFLYSVLLMKFWTRWGSNRV
jgi:hypothetical protein